ncbi:helix-turn-helix domain-containing protein [Salinirubellus sp. GCM10025818]|uniref:helix-turn-helix domain-containing protein n=1 Tax=Salinirubellus TaxID=2162630 RepID=UPI0030CFB521
MSVVAEFTIPAGTFGLGRLLTSESEARIGLERHVPTREEVMPYFWVEMADGDFEAFERELRENEIVRELNVLDRMGDQTLYAIEWERIPESLIQGIAQSDGAILEGRAVDGRWRFMIRFPDHARLTEFHEFLSEQDIAIHVDRVYTRGEGDDRQEHDFDLTEEQRETLTSAVQRGYFEVPRGVTLTDLADELGISRQAASERLRRGANTVLRNVLPESHGETGPEGADDTSP